MNHTIYKQAALHNISEFMNTLGVPEHLKASVLVVYSTMFPRDNTDGTPHVFDSQVDIIIACLLMILVIERPEAGEHAEYKRLRGIAQTFAHEFVYPDGYASLFEGEPEFYGIVNALLVKVCQVYGDPNSDKCKKEEGDK